MPHNTWFFREPHFFVKMALIYIRGDMIALIPLWMIIIGVGMASLYWAGILISVFFACRFFGEMMYWLLQQFSDRRYRPYDFGFRTLDNHALYILYQTWSLVGLVLSLSIFLFLWKEY